MSHQINMPPDSGVRPLDVIVDDCLEVGDTLTLNVKDVGFIAHSPDGLFDPELPTGLFLAKTTLGPFVPRTASTKVVLAYCDLTSGNLYVTNLKIESKCPKHVRDDVSALDTSAER